MFFEIFALIAALLLFLYWYITQDYGKYAAKGIPEATPTFPIGSKPNWLLLTARKGFLDFLDCLYTEYPNDPFVVHWTFGKPAVHVRDLELIKRILIKDFDHFVDRRSFDMDEEANKYFKKMLTVIKGEEWKQMRHIMSPVFTSGKLKAMGGLVQNVGDDMVEHLKEYAKEGKPYESKQMMVNFALDAILSSGFGVQADSFKNPDGVIRKQIDKMTGGGKTSFKQTLQLVILFAIPKVFKWAKMSFIPADSMEFFIRIIRDAMKQRKEGGKRRNDFVDLFIDAMKDSGKEEIEVEEGQFDQDAVIKPTKVKKIDSEEYELLMVSNAMLLFFAGFDTSSSIMSIAQWFLAKNPDVQETLYQEIKETVEREGTERLDYNAVQGMEYIDMFVHEVIRHYPLTPLERECVKEYKIPNSDMVIKPGMLVQIASKALMQDPQYYTNPTEFNPLNFSAEAKKERNPYAFVGFGQGPRNCIGMRFALLQLKIALSRLVYNFKIVPNAKTVDKLVVDPKSQNGAPIGQCWVSLEMRS